MHDNCRESTGNVNTLLNWLDSTWKSTIFLGLLRPKRTVSP